MFAFDLKTPSGNLKKTLLWTGCAVLVASLILGTAFYLKKHRKQENTPHRIEMAKGVESGFFASPSSQDSQDKKPEEAKPADTQNQANSMQSDKKPTRPLRKGEFAQRDDMPPLPPLPPSYLPPPPVRAYTSRELFAPIPPRSQPTEAEIAEDLNAARRGTSVLKVSMDESHHQNTPRFITTQKDWGEQKTTATFPVNMERVIPVTRRISAVLVEAIHSELEGKVTAQIEENIYGAQGRNILIPAGSQAVGRYKPLSKSGETRIAILWSRIITPDGINITVGNAEMADAMGRSGLTGNVDSRFFDRYGMALLVSTLSAATAYAIPVQSQGQAVVIQTYGNNISQLSGQILDKNINIRPIVTIPAGTRILISPTKDIWFKKPEQDRLNIVALNDEGDRN